MVAPTINVRPEEALTEKVRREKARRHLVDFSQYIFPWYKPARHHIEVAFYLEQVETFIRSCGKSGIGRLLIFEPPRHGKSEQASKHFPAWVLGKHPDSRVIVTSYGADLATKFSRGAREIVLSDRFKALFGDLSPSAEPVELSEDSRSVQSWDLSSPHRGGLMAAGVGGALTGSGANLFIVDDPFKNRAEAESEDRRDFVWDFWTSTGYTRLEENGAVIGMLTRWHGDDWAGRLIKAMATDPKADQYVVICLPAIAEEPEIPESKSFEDYQREKMLEGIWIEKEDLLGRKPGEALWPQKYDEGDLERIEANVGPYDWAALYQQRPYLRSGTFFKREWFSIVEAPPKSEEIVNRIRYWDKAGTKTGQGGDFAAGVLMSVTRDGMYYVEHVIRGQWTPGERDDEMIRTSETDKGRPGMRVSIWHQQDPGSAGLDSAQATNRMLAKRGFMASFETVTGDKEVRAGPWSSMCQGGAVRLVRGGWNQAFIEEHVSFPKGNHDDQVDAASGAFSKLARPRGVFFK